MTQNEDVEAFEEIKHYSALKLKRCTQEKRLEMKHIERKSLKS